MNIQSAGPALLRSHRSMAGFLFVSLFILYLSSPVIPLSDTKYSIFTSISLLRHGDINLDEYADLLQLYQRHAIVDINGHSYDYFPAGTSILAAPIVYILSRFYGYGYIESHSAQFEIVIAGIFMSLATVNLFYILTRRIPLTDSLIFAFLIGAGTSFLSTGSRALWQQSASVLLFSLFLNLLDITDTRRKRWPYLIALGVIAVMGFEARPMAVLWILPFSLIFLLRKARAADLPFLMIGAAIPALVLGWLHLSSYDSLFAPYVDAGRVFHFATLTEAFAVNTISPQRGFFVWSPFFAIAFYSFVRILNERSIFSELTASWITVLAHLLILSTFPHYWGGHSIGPRLMTETIPAFCILSIPGIQYLRENNRPWKTGLFALLSVMSIVIHIRSAHLSQVNEWNRYPMDVDAHPERLWDWTDMQFLRAEHGFRTLFRLPVDPAVQRAYEKK